MEALWESEKIGVVNENPVFRRVMQNFTTNFHTHHESDEMFIIESGKLQIDCEVESFQLTQGDSFVVKAGLEHRVVANRKVALIVIGGHGT